MKSRCHLHSVSRLQGPGRRRLAARAFAKYRRNRHAANRSRIVTPAKYLQLGSFLEPIERAEVDGYLFVVDRDDDAFAFRRPAIRAVVSERRCRLFGGLVEARGQEDW